MACYRDVFTFTYKREDMKNSNVFIMHTECFSENLALSGHLKDLAYVTLYKVSENLESMRILIIGSMTYFLIDGLGGEAQWSGHHDHITLTAQTLHFGNS
jgi:hypothetical protein